MVERGRGVGVTYYSPASSYAINAYVLGTGVYGTAGVLYRATAPIPIGAANAPPGASWATISATAVAPYSTLTAYTSGAYILGNGTFGTLDTVYLASQNVPAGNTYAPGIDPAWVSVTSPANGTLAIYDPVGYSTWAIAYYPQPPAITLNVAGTTGTDIGGTYPDNLVPEIFVYQMAVDIRIKAKVPSGEIGEQLGLTSKTLEKAMLKDNNKPESVRDVFASGFAPWV